MKLLRIVGLGVGVLIVIALGVYAWAGYAAGRKLSRSYAVHRQNFVIPSSSADTATSAALERGRHLVDSRYACRGCHGSDLGGGVMIDAPAMGRILGPNLTTGNGSVTAGFTPADWDRIVRHGIKRDGKPALMPSQDFRGMSDRELADIVVFLRAQPAVDRRMPPPTLGPVGKMLVATGKFTLSADLIRHDSPHPPAPPETGPTVEFGRHLAATCTGCHGENLGGGPIVGGDPSWPPAANLTRAALGDWTFEQFVTTLREGKRPDGTHLRNPMAELLPYAQRMTETELRALWTYLRSVPPVEDHE
jgi:mono/diheme cytochrome c family protein